ncbi:hypothetical protein AB3Y40_05620 [Yoonia sp. R2331]|uniref:hypothetical protein n=1 Tax=Yoonia sp. R2331 TaxID=3237238 RepID=UPI0034E38C8B
MVDYTTGKTGGSGIGLYLAAGVVVLVLLYALFAGGGSTTTLDPATLSEDPGAAIAVEPDAAAPAVTE